MMKNTITQIREKTTNVTQDQIESERWKQTLIGDQKVKQKQNNKDNTK